MSARMMDRSRGFTLIEVLATLAIGALLLAGLAGLVNSSLDDMKGQQAAYYQQQVAQAAAAYVRAKATDLRTQAATPTTLVPVTVGQLKAARFLPDAFAEVNPYRQRTCVLIRQPDPASYPGRFDALVVTTGGDPIGDKDLPAVAMQAGSGGGYIAAAAPGTARGASWEIQTTAWRGTACPGGVALQGTVADGGHLATSLFYDGAAQQTQDFLYRNLVEGQADANRLNTPLRLGGTGVSSPGASCTNTDGVAEPALALDATTRTLLTCTEAGTWVAASSWKQPVENYATLATLLDNTPGDVRMVTGLKRAFTFDGAGWVALAVDQDGNFNVPGTSAANVLLARQKVESEGSMDAAGHISTKMDVNVGQDVLVKRNVEVERDVTVKHQLTSRGVLIDDWLTTPAMEVVDVFKPGDACHYPVVDPMDGPAIAYPHGTVVMDEQRRPLICGPDKTFRYSNGQYTIN